MFQVIFRTIFFYLFVILCYRIMGKREIGELDVIDLIVSILIAELIAISIENHTESIFLTIIPISLLVGLEILLAFSSIKSKKFRTLLDGKPSYIIINGKINYHEMVKQRYSLDNLLLSLRNNGIKDISEVEYAFLETNGELSIFKYNLFKTNSSFPLPIILDGSIDYKVLKEINKNEAWLKNELAKNNIKLENIFYCFYKLNKLYIIKKDDLI